MNDTLRVGVVGIGHLGSRHLKIYQDLPGVTVTGICDLEPERLHPLTADGGPEAVRDYRDLAGRVDAVNICVPTSGHYAAARFFLEQGVHTFIEKPMTVTLEEADELIRLAEQNNLRLQIGHVERFNAAFRAIRDICQDPLFIECHRLNFFPHRSLDIGVVMDLMIHDIDIILGLNRSSVESFHAVGVHVLTAFEDIASARIIFANGCVCNLTASRVSDDVMRKIRIFLRDAYISLDYVKQEAFIYRKNGALITKEALPIEKEEPLRKELESFIACVRSGEAPVVSGVEGREALKLALEISEAVTRGRDKILAGGKI